MSALEPVKAEVARTGDALAVLRRLSRDPMGAIGLVIVISFLATALFADVLAPYDPIKIDILHKLQGPSLAHLFGTDQLGRDTLSRLIHGAQIALMVAAVSIGIAVVIGSILGSIAGYGPSWLDFVIMCCAFWPESHHHHGHYYRNLISNLWSFDADPDANSSKR
jgi:ABC-type dipeptide/oligopeptide/nickel transport system permease subunit